MEIHPPYLILAAGLGNKAAAVFQLGLCVSFQPEWNLAPPLWVFLASVIEQSAIMTLQKHEYLNRSHTCLERSEEFPGCGCSCCSKPWSHHSFMPELSCFLWQSHTTMWQGVFRVTHITSVHFLNECRSGFPELHVCRAECTFYMFSLNFCASCAVRRRKEHAHGVKNESVRAQRGNNHILMRQGEKSLGVGVPAGLLAP